MITSEYIRGYLDGLCEDDYTGIYYDSENNQWVCGDNEKTVALDGDKVLVNGHNEIDVSKITSVYLLDRTVFFEMKVAI